MKTFRYMVMLLLYVTLLSTPVFTEAQSLIVQTKYGKVEGISEESIQVFKGIPFAAPPVGNLRWRPPQPPTPWTGVKKCIAFSASPIQPNPIPFLCWTAEFIAPPAPLSEDCLYLNVWTGALSSHEKRPVFVWIYGGGFRSGSAAVAIYDGEEYAKKGIVFVSFNYRVGALGFMAHPGLTKEGNGSSGNYGLMDQVAALKWVNENIAAFGGDPARVTIGGQSAGATSVTDLKATATAKGLFQKAIAESGGSLGGSKTTSLADGEKNGLVLQEKLGVNGIDEMRAMPAEQVLKGSQAMGVFQFGPVCDGVFLPIDLDKSFREGKFNQVNFLGGWLTGDAALFDKQTTPEAFVKMINEKYGEKAAKLLVLLPHENPDQATRSQSTLNLISIAVLSPYRLSKYNSKPDYIYEFSHVPAEKPGFPDYGVFHTSEVPYALHTLHMWDRPWRESDIMLEEKMSNYWINFIKSGNPNAPNLTNWETYQSGFSLELGDPIQGKNNLYKDILEVLASE